MPVYTLFILNETGVCVYYQSFLTVAPPEAQLTEHKQFVSGLVESLIKVSADLNPLDAPNVFKSFATTTYKFHYFQTPTLTRFVLLSDPAMPDAANTLLKQYYEQVFVPFVVKNPFYTRRSEDIWSDRLAAETSRFFADK